MIQRARAGTRALLLAGALLSALPTRAEPAAPAPAPALAQGYGPLTVCIGGYAMQIAADEGVVLSGQEGTGRPGLTAFTERFGRIIVRPDARDDARKFSVTAATLPGLGVVERRNYPEQGYYRAGIPGEAVWQQDPPHREYLLPAAAGLGPLRVTAEAFAGRGDDRVVLARFAPRTAATRCDRPRADGAEPVDVPLWSPVWTEGPANLCAGLLLFPLGAGERARHWWPWDGGGPLGWEVFGPGYRFGPFGFRAADAGHRATGRLPQLGYRFVPGENGTALLEPPAAGKRDLESFSVQYRAGGPTMAARLAERLELVRPGDPRCRPARPGRR